MQTDFSLPPAQILLRDFAKRHHLQFTDLVSREEIAIRSTSVANILINQAYTRLDDRILDDPAIALLLNMLHRNVEHAEGAIVAFVSGCGASTEVISRASIESSVNILYILAGDRMYRLQAYFEHYLGEVDRQVEKWRAHVGDLAPSEAAVYRKGAEKRRAANNALRRFLRGLMGSSQERWPTTIAERFRGIGEDLARRTFYARMRSESHADADRTFYARMRSESHADTEETLRYLVGCLQPDPTLFETMALETVWTTRLYFHYAVSLFLKASIAYAGSYSLGDLQDRLRTELADVEDELIEIASHV